MENNSTLDINPLNVDAMDNVDISSPQDEDNEEDIFQSTVQVRIFSNKISLSLRLSISRRLFLHCFEISLITLISFAFYGDSIILQICLHLKNILALYYFPAFLSI